MTLVFITLLILAYIVWTEYKIRAGVCEWSLELWGDGDSWETSCGESFQFIDGGPEENKFIFCCYCSRLIEVVEYEDEDDEPS